VEESRLFRKRQEMEVKENHGQKLSLKKQLEETDGRMRKMMRELEDESKRHIAEVN